jgi:hypothetical protein
MPNQSKKPFEVVESERFIADVTRLIGDFKRWDEIKETFDLDIACNPHKCDKVPSIDLYAMGLLTSPLTTVCFTIDDKNKTIKLEALILSDNG